LAANYPELRRLTPKPIRLQSLVVQQRHLYRRLDIQLLLQQAMHSPVDLRRVVHRAHESNVFFERLTAHIRNQAHAAIRREGRTAREQN
jgi:hypothetical protein